MNKGKHLQSRVSVKKQLRRADMTVLEKKARRAKLRIKTGCHTRVVSGFKKETSFDVPEMYKNFVTKGTV